MFVISSTSYFYVFKRPVVPDCALKTMPLCLTVLNDHNQTNIQKKSKFHQIIINNPIVPFIQAQPSWLQFIELLIVVDFTTYRLSRAMHEVDFFWRFHAIHHSTEEMDWLASSRLHVVEVLMTRFLATLLIFLLGFHTSTVFAYLVFISFHAIFIHANVRFRFPYLRYLIATPEFHHWLHSSEKSAIDKNYAAFIPLYDVIFKSVYMPNHFHCIFMSFCMLSKILKFVVGDKGLIIENAYFI